MTYLSLLRIALLGLAWLIACSACLALAMVHFYGA